VPAASEISRAAAQKVSQLAAACRLGFQIPPTLVTTDPDELLDFYCAHDGKIVTKVIEQLSLHHQDEGFFRLTEWVSTRDLGYAGAIRLCPVIVQPYVPKAFEVRVTVVGGAVFAAEIHSQASNRARLDWRSYDRSSAPHRVHSLPPEMAARCRGLVDQLGLCYGALDLIVTPDGRYVFLELNPQGQYLWIEEATGLPISEALCDLLLGRDARQAHAHRGEHIA
jgi:glutathione synthase/RimK-type ligase-like ATP-grasp enzyme